MKEPKIKIFFTPQSKDTIGWVVCDDDYETAKKNADLLETKYNSESVTQEVDRGIEFAPEPQQPQPNPNSQSVQQAVPIEDSQANVCPKCGSNLKYIEGGVSKRTGKAYSAFTACTNKQCNYTKN